MLLRSAKEIACWAKPRRCIWEEVKEKRAEGNSLAFVLYSRLLPKVGDMLRAGCEKEGIQVSSYRLGWLGPGEPSFDLERR